MRFGLSNNTVAIIHAIFKRYPSLDKAVLYGSRAKGNYKKGSDIDLTFFGDDLNYTALINIANDLDDSAIPYFVDASIFKNIDNDLLREHIERVGVVFYEREA